MDGKTIELGYDKAGLEKAEKLKRKGAKVTYHPPKSRKSKR